MWLRVLPLTYTEGGEPDLTSWARTTHMVKKKKNFLMYDSAVN